MLQRLIHHRKRMGFLLLPVVWFVWTGVPSHKKNVISHRRVPVEVQAVVAQPFPIRVRAMGELVAARHVDIVPEVAGHVAQVFSLEGGVSVRQGAGIIQLEDAGVRARLASAKAALAYSQADYLRKTTLAKRGVVSPQATDQALADLKARQAAVQSATVDLSAMRLSAPFDGTLGRMHVMPGEYVAAGQKLVALTDTRHLRVEYTVPERYLASLKPGQAVTVTTAAWPQKSFAGHVTFISPTVNSTNRSLTLYADIPNTEKWLTAGLFVEVEQTLGDLQNALVVPPASLTSTLEGQMVFKVTSGHAEGVPVVVLRRNTDQVQIQGAVLPGDLIVVAGQQRCRDGMPVEVIQAS